MPTTADPPLPPWRLCLHARTHWRRDGGPAQPLERKHAALLAWLWLEGPTPRSRLAGLLWPEVPEERARGNLRQRLLKLRQDAGGLIEDSGGVLSLAAGVVVDPPDPPGAPLLQALAFDDCEALARWLDGRREAERERRKREWLAEVRDAARSQRLDDALYAADQLLQTDRESEEAFRVLMEVYYLRGDHAAALSAWDRCRDMLRQLYGVQPSAATRALGDTILAAARDAESTCKAEPSPGPNAPPARPLPAAVLRPPRLVARAAALQALQTMPTLTGGWADATAAGGVPGAAVCVCVCGEAGVGKSRLLADWASGLGAVVHAGARPGDAVQPYAAISRLVLAAIDRFPPGPGQADLRLAARILPRLAAWGGWTVEPVRTEHERTQALLALARVLAGCAARGARAFILDDLQFADSASIGALRVLVEPGAGGGHVHGTDPLRWAFGLRPDETGADLQAFIDALQAEQRWQRVDLALFGQDEAAEFLRSLDLPGVDTEAWAPALWRQVGGNPAFLLESVKLLLSIDSPAPPGTDALPLPPSIEAVIQRRIALLSPRARHLAQLAAIAGTAYGIPLAAAALACAPIELSEPLRELELRQVFYGRRFVHDVIAGVTLAAVPSAVADFMHRFVAEHLVQHGGDPAEVAAHWQACAEWRRAGTAWAQAARAAGAAALSNDQAALLDRAIAALEHDPAAHDELFTALEDRANVFESVGHAGLRPQIIERLRALARTEAQQLSALNHRNGWLANLAQPIEEDRILAGIPRAEAVGRPDLAWYLARMLGLHWAMNDRAADGLALLHRHGPWIESDAGRDCRTAYRLTLSSIHAFGDRLPEAIAEGRRALEAAMAAQDWPSALPAMSNVGLMHYWRGEFEPAHEVLSRARDLRDRCYGRGGDGLKIDIHLGAVLYERGEHDAARELLERAVADMQAWPDNEYRRTDCLLADNHLAQMYIALGEADQAAAVLAHDAHGVADRFLGRRLSLRLRWQRLFGRVDPALVDELQAVAARVASPFNQGLMRLELSRHRPPAQAAPLLRALHDSPMAVQRPGVQLHAAALAAQASARAGCADEAAAWVQSAEDLARRCAPFDLPVREMRAMLAEAGGPVAASATRQSRS